MTREDIDAIFEPRRPADIDAALDALEARRNTLKDEQRALAEKLAAFEARIEGELANIRQALKDDK